MKQKAEQEIERIKREVLSMGGVCKTKIGVKKLLARQSSNSKKVKCLKTQILYHKKVINTKVSDKKLFAFSPEGKKCSITVLKRKLIAVIDSTSES